MATTVKNKIRGGTIFLFLLLLLSGGLGIYFVVQLKTDAQGILKNNYESLTYAHNMQQSLDSLANGYAEAGKGFTHHLTLQESNLTEPGEAEATATIRTQFNSLAAGGNPKAIAAIGTQLQQIIDLNMTAIENRNMTAVKTADDALTYLTFIVAIIFIISLSFVYNFPSIVTDPIREFTGAIQQIGAKNYKYRIHIDRTDEFGQMADAYNSMAERLEYFESSNLNKILFEKTRAEAVIKSLKDASIGIDNNGIILFANDQALQLLGLVSTDMAGKTVNELSSRNDLFKFLIDETGVSPFKVVLDQRENYFTKEIMELDQGESAGNRVIVIKNITSFKELDVAKTNFIATISHELKTPLASSDFGIKLLEDQRIGSLSIEQSEIVEQLRNDNQRMLRILSELLNLSQVESGKMELKLSEGDAVSVIDGAINSVRALSQEKEIRFEKRIPDPSPKFKADIEKVGWVLNNLLSNAVKFSPQEGRIFISVVVDPRTITFSVIDEGKGISPQYLPKLFDRYFRVPGNDILGTGLGLTISKEFVEAMGGQIYATSEPGDGSHFSFALPLS